MKTNIFRQVFFIFLCWFGLINGANSQLYDFSKVNSYADEINPLLSEDGSTLYIIRGHHEANIGGRRDLGDIWVSELQEGNVWSDPVRFDSSLNNTLFNGIFFQSGSAIYLFQHYTRDGTAPRTQGFSESKGSTGSGFSFPSKLDVKYYLNRSDHVSASISEDRSIMILALDSYGSYGGEDLYVSFRQPDNSWTTPRNLGSGLNTIYQEMTPFLLDDNATLFFSSNGYGGYGGRDVFVTRRLDDSWMNWSEPVNLGPEVNTEGVELYFNYDPDRELAIFSTTQNSEGYSDIRNIRFSLDVVEDILDDPLPTPEVIVAESGEEAIKEAVSVEENEALDDASLQLFGNVYGSGDSMKIDAHLVFISETDTVTTVANPSGYEIEVSSSSVYQVTIKADGFVGKTTMLDVRTAEIPRFRQDFTLLPIEDGTVVQLNNVLFQRGTTQLLDSSYPELDLVVEMMQENNDISIFLEGHTDNRGDSFANLKLSQERVDRVIEYLTDHGISSSRLDGKGYGGSRPIASNANEETRRLNRRVEFTIMKK